MFQNLPRQHFKTVPKGMFNMLIMLSTKIRVNIKWGNYVTDHVKMHHSDQTTFCKNLLSSL